MKIICITRCEVIIITLHFDCMIIYLDPDDDPVCCIFVLDSPLSVDRLLPLLIPPDPGLGDLCG